MNKFITFLCLNALLTGNAVLAMYFNPAARGHELLVAAYQGNQREVETLLNAGIHVDAKNYYGRTPLMCATEYNHKKTCQLLLDRSADVDAKDNVGNTSLLIAAQKGHEDICKLLLVRNAQVNTKNKHSLTPFMLAHKNIYKLLISPMIKQIDKSAATTLLGMSRFKRATCMNGIDRNVIRLIAGYVVDADTKNLFAQIGTTKYKDLFAQIDSIEDASMHDSIRAYAKEQLKMDQKTNNGDSHE